MVVGGGPAGLTAAVYGVRRGLSCVVAERMACGGQMTVTSTLENWPGEVRVSGGVLAGLGFLVKPGECMADSVGRYGRLCKVIGTITYWGGLGAMSTQIWQEGVVLVEVPGEPETSEELDSVTRLVQDSGDCDVVVDLGAARILTSMSLAALLRLRDLQNSRGRRLVLCGVDSATKGILSITSLDTVFEIVRDRVDAFATVQASPDG